MWKKILFSFGVFSAATIIICIFLLNSTIKQIKDGEYIKASNTASNALIIFKPLSKITFHKIPDIEYANFSMELIKKIPEYINQFSENKEFATNEDYIFNLEYLLNTLQSIRSELKQIVEYQERTVLVKTIIGDKNHLKSKDLLTNITDLLNVVRFYSNGDHRAIIVFQNSDELRATGGFIGSYAIIDISDAKVDNFSIEDIYDAEGQFTGFIEPPDGVKQYLSGNDGFKISNSNWFPDFPKSAQQTLQFLELGNKTKIETLLAVNPDYAKLILEVIGEINLQDYNTIVDSNNISEVLRTRRSDFFPGSKQKKHILSQLLNQIKIKIFKLDSNQISTLIKGSIEEINKNNMQFYSNIEAVDNIFSKHKLRKETKIIENSEYLYLVESNVGINKANKGISRSVDVNLQNNLATIKINFKNNNFAPTISILSDLIEEDSNDPSGDSINHLGYANYQRILVLPDWELKEVKYNNQIISEWHENIIVDSSGEEFKEIGFIITLKEKSESELEISFDNTDQVRNKIFIQKQPGLPNTDYSVEIDGQKINQVLSEDHLFEL